MFTVIRRPLQGILTGIGECVLSIDAGWEEACLFSGAFPSDLHSSHKTELTQS